ncbi:zinc finger protein [Elysia marginata]|uniref:Zinc finger protein n=1 Tax=Elysia marginata TaxID=1093978 RepID=A0AAV4JQP5_9GAST|nr:zinc finger protein [Elysia marginata]
MSGKSSRVAKKKGDPTHPCKRICLDIEGENFNDSDCETLPELGGWGSNETVNDLQYSDQLTPDQRRQLEEIASSYSSIFSDRPGTVSTEEHRIELTSSTPVRQRPYPVPYAMRQTLRDELKKMEDLEIIRKSSSPYSSPVVARNRIKRLFSLVLCVDRFIKCVAMIAGDTQTLLKDTTQQQHKSTTRSPAKDSTGEERPEKDIAFFNVHNYVRVGQVQVPFHIQLILSKPWFCRTNKDVETAVRFLEKMRCFTAYPRPFQFMLARVAWYLELPTQKVVIRQSQQAVNFYLLLNGSVRIDRLEGSPCDDEVGYFRTLNVLSSQDMFGVRILMVNFAE